MTIFQSEMNVYSSDIIEPTEYILETKESNILRMNQRRAIIFLAFINVGMKFSHYFLKIHFLLKILLFIAAVVIALGLLTIWHAKLIYRGETSIEAHINASETKRLSSQGKQYQNPYDFGSKKNFQLFLGLVNGRCIE